MRVRVGLALVGCVAVALAAGCGGGREEPFRIGILADCYGPFSSVYEVIAASADLPLLERGGTLRGDKPSAGVRGATIAGRPVELRFGCVHSNEEVIPEARRLVEEEGVSLLLGIQVPQEGMVLRDYARRRPQTTFLIQPSDAPELTLADPAPNVFRFAADAAQATAGLGRYAYRTLGWRRAVTVGDDVPYGWETISGFVAEFCALGGRVVTRKWVPLGSDPAKLVHRLPSSADGVYLGTALAPTAGFLEGYSTLHRDLARHLLAANTVLFDPQVLPLARGIVAAGGLPFEGTRAANAYVAAFTKAFPHLPAGAALAGLAVPYRDGVEAALEALDRAGGSEGRNFRHALARVRVSSPTGPIRLDGNRQAIVSNYLSRVMTGADGKPAIRTLRVVPDVEQTFGGYFTGQPATRTQPACRKTTAPRWAQ
jgi:branched-chain amino acid transport system substrate-binding protein